MNELHPKTKAEKQDVLCELDCSQLAEVTGGYQPVFVPIGVFLQPFTYDEAPSPGVHIVQA